MEARLHTPFRQFFGRLFTPRYVKLIVHVDVLREMGGHWAQMAEAADAHRSVFLPKFVVTKLPERFDPIAEMQRKLDAGEYVSFADPNRWAARGLRSSRQSHEPPLCEDGPSQQTHARSGGEQ